MYIYLIFIKTLKKNNFRGGFTIMKRYWMGPRQDGSLCSRVTLTPNRPRASPCTLVCHVLCVAARPCTALA